MNYYLVMADLVPSLFLVSMLPSNCLYCSRTSKSKSVRPLSKKSLHLPTAPGRFVMRAGARSRTSAVGTGVFCVCTYLLLLDFVDSLVREVEQAGHGVSRARAIMEPV
jgi:hypothetical protein